MLLCSQLIKNFLSSFLNVFSIPGTTNREWCVRDRQKVITVIWPDWLPFFLSKRRILLLYVEDLTFCIFSDQLYEILFYVLSVFRKIYFIRTPPKLRNKRNLSEIIGFCFLKIWVIVSHWLDVWMIFQKIDTSCGVPVCRSCPLCRGRPETSWQLLREGILILQELLSWVA